MIIDPLPLGHPMAAILDLILIETLKAKNSIENEFSTKNHVKTRYYMEMCISKRMRIDLLPL